MHSDRLERFFLSLSKECRDRSGLFVVDATLVVKEADPRIKDQFVPVQGPFLPDLLQLSFLLSVKAADLLASVI